MIVISIERQSHITCWDRNPAHVPYARSVCWPLGNGGDPDLLMSDTPRRIRIMSSQDTAPVIGEEKLNLAVRRLAQFLPFEAGGESLRAALTDLLLIATQTNGGSFEGLTQSREAIHELWGLDLEIDELRAAKESLEKSGLLKRDDVGFSLTQTAREDLDKRSESASQLEKTALGQWEKTLLSLDPTLTVDNISALKQDLDAWLAQIIARHGVEAAMILYPEEPRAAELFSAIDSLGTSFLPTRPAALARTRETALQDFVRHPTAEQRAVLSGRLNTAFYLTVLTIDPNAKEIPRQTDKTTRIYLDTNFLYSLLGAASANEVVSANRLLELCLEVGYELAVTPWTIAELRKSIQSDRQQISSTPVIRGLAQLMSEVSGEKGYAAAYWKSYQKDGVTVDDFFDRAEHFEYELPKWSIEVEDESCAKIEAQDQAIQDLCSVMHRISGVSARHPDVIRHDVEHRMLIERLRGDGVSGFATAHYWFLTQDNKLPRFARMMFDSDAAPPEVPFCISPSTLVQIVRSLTPRTEDYDQLVVDLLASPLLGYRAAIDHEAVQRVVSRVDLHKESSPELMLAVLQDKFLVDNIKSAGTEEDIDARVEESFSTKARQLQEQATTSAELAASERSQRVSAEKESDEFRKSLEGEKEQRESLERELGEEREARRTAEAQRLAAEGKQSSHQSEVTSVRTELEREKAISELSAKNLEEFKSRTKRRTIGWGAAVTAWVAAAFALATGAVSGTTWWIIVLCTAACLSVAGVSYAAEKERGAQIREWFFGVVGVTGLAITLIEIGTK